jgi:hypothetical protein
VGSSAQIATGLERASAMQCGAGSSPVRHALAAQCGPHLDAAIRRLFPMSPALKTAIRDGEFQSRRLGLVLSFPLRWRYGESRRPPPRPGNVFHLTFVIERFRRLAILAGGLRGVLSGSRRASTRAATVLSRRSCWLRPCSPPQFRRPTMPSLGSLPISTRAIQAADLALPPTGSLSGRSPDGGTILRASFRGAAWRAQNRRCRCISQRDAAMVAGAGIAGRADRRNRARRDCLDAGRQPTRPAIAAATGQLVAAFTMANLSFGIWQGWWVAVLILSAAMAATVRDER